jgi:hypothetical protein
MLLSVTPPSPFASAPVCGHVMIDRAVTFLTNHMNKIGACLRGADIDVVTAASDWTAKESAIFQVIDASFLPVIGEHSGDLPVYHIFDSHIRNATAAVLSRLPLGYIWRFEPISMNPTLFTSLSLQFRCVYLQKYSLVSHLSQSKSIQRHAELLKPESIFRLAEIVVMLVRSMPANSTIWLHKLAAELGNPSLGAPVVRYFDIFSFRLLPSVLRSNCALMLLNVACSRMKALLSNIQSQQFPLHFRVLNDFVVVMAQCVSESFELHDDIWEMLPETSCRIIIRCMSLASECSSAALKATCSVTSHLRRLSSQARMREWGVSSWGRCSSQLCEPFRSAFRADRKMFSEDINVVSAEEELLKGLHSNHLSSPQRVIHWLREKKHSVLKLKNLFICFWDMMMRNPESPSLVFYENTVWRDSLITWVQCLSSATECSQACFALVAHIASNAVRAGGLCHHSLPTARALDFLVWESNFAPFHDMIVAICDCDHDCSVDWLLHLLRPGCRLEQACLAYSAVIFAGARPCSAFEQNSLFTRRGAPDIWMLPNHRAALDAAEECMPTYTPVADFATISASYRLFHAWPACALPAVIHAIITLIQRQMWNECSMLCDRYRYLFLFCSTPITTARRLLAAALNRRAPFATCLAILGFAWGMAPSLPFNMPSILALAHSGDVSSLVCFAVDCVQPLLQHSRDDDSLIAAAFGHSEQLCMMREHLDPRTCNAAVGTMLFLLAHSVDTSCWHRLLSSDTADAASIGFLIASLPASCAAAAVGDLLSPGQPPSELAVHVCTVLMAASMSLVLAQRIITLATVQLHCALSCCSSRAVLTSTRLLTCIPLDLHREVTVSELLWSFFSSFVDGCSRWQLSDTPASTSTGTAISHTDASESFGEASDGQFRCTPSRCSASYASHVSVVLATHPDLGLAYDLFCSVIFDAGKIRKYSASLFANISVAAKIFFQLLAADLKPGDV